MPLPEEQKITVLLVSDPNMTPDARERIKAILGQGLEVTSSTIDKIMNQSKALLYKMCKPEEAEYVRNKVLSAGISVELLEENIPSEECLEERLRVPSDDEVADFMASYIEGLKKSLSKVSPEEVSQLVEALLLAREHDRQIFIIGNGGSASLASHFATDLIKERFPDPKYLFRVISLTDNSSIITATANDFGYDQSFVNQLRPLLRSGDLVIAISSSGNSPNILKALEYAAASGATSVGILGFDGGRAASLVDLLVKVPCKNGQYGFAEDCTSAVIHMTTVMLYERDLKEVERNSPAMRVPESLALIEK